MKGVFVIAMLGFASCILALKGFTMDGTVYVLTMLVAVLLFGHNKADAEEHFA